jgi:hypothetical protein
MFLPRVTGRTVTPAVLIGLGMSVLWSYWREIFRTPYDLSIMWAIALPCTFTLMLAAAFSLIFESGDDHPGRRYTWRAVMQRPMPDVIPND